MYNNNGFLNPYPNTPYPNTPFSSGSNPFYPTPQIPQHHEIIHVNGENGAKTFQMSENSNVLLLDDTAPIIWHCQTDGAGYKTLTAYDIKPHVSEKPEESLMKLEERITKLEELINAKQSDKPVNARNSNANNQKHETNG